MKGSAPHTYTYGNEDWGDLLTSYDGESITYDGIGNPTSYYNGTRWSFGWEHGRELVSASNGTTTWNYTYNSDGLRTQRTNGTNIYRRIRIVFAGIFVWSVAAGWESFLASFAQFSVFRCVNVERML